MVTEIRNITQPIIITEIKQIMHLKNVVEFNTIIKHMIGYTWWPVLMIEEEHLKTPGKNH
jgi:hypothetical protein